MNDLIYDGQSLNEYGFLIKKDPGHEIAERDMELIDIIGGEGSELNDSEGYKNVDRVYEINSFPYWNKHKSDIQIDKELTSWLYSKYTDYKILRDTYNPGYFCYAIPKAPNIIAFKAKRLLDTTLTFTRKPFWYSDKGQEKIIKEFNTPVASASIKLLNPESIESTPLIVVDFSSNSGTFTLSEDGANWSPIIVDLNVTEIEIDAAAENIQGGEIDLNDVSICDYFPKLLPGNNQLNFSAEDVSITKITIIPRWRRL